VHQLPTDQAEGALTAFGDALVDDACLTDAALQAERDRFDNLNAKLHAGPVRVYPDRRTSMAIFGIPREIGRALGRRKARRPSP